MLKQIFVGGILLVIGGALVMYSAKLSDMFGRIAWADYYLGSSRAAYVLIGFALIVYGFLYMFGVTGGENHNSDLAGFGKVK